MSSASIRATAFERGLDARCARLLVLIGEYIAERFVRLRLDCDHQGTVIVLSDKEEIDVRLFAAEPVYGNARFAHDPEATTTAEATLLGGLKTKEVDIVAIKEGIGPVLAVSCKGMTGAVRNLTNRLEETIGESTNIHIAYPNLVFGYLFLIRANREGDPVAPNDVVLDRDGRPVEGVRRFHQALGAMTGRLGLRNDASRYEAIAMSLVEVSPDHVGELTPDFPPGDSPVHLDQFFRTMYERYDERYVVSAPSLARRTRRLEWAPDSPAFEAPPFRALDYGSRTRA